MQAAVILKAYRSLVWPELKKYLKTPSYPTAFKIPSKYKDDVSTAFTQTVKDYPERKGKYIRPTLLILTAEAMGANSKDTLKTAAAMQLSEEWILVHDDFEDNSLMRRGKETLQRLYGPELAINAGDALHIACWKAMIDSHILLGKDKAEELLNEFYRILSRTALGQAVEIKWTKENKLPFSDSDWLFIADSKSSYYSITGPIRLGAIIANANPKQLELLTKFGVHLGRCWQLVDDILDVTSNFSGLKKTGGDVYEGKRTILLGHLYKNVSLIDRKILDSFLAKKAEERTEQEVNWVIKKMHEYGSIEYCNKLADGFRNKALAVFNKELTFLSHQPARNKIESLVHFILERTY